MKAGTLVWVLSCVTLQQDRSTSHCMIASGTSDPGVGIVIATNSTFTLVVLPHGNVAWVSWSSLTPILE